MSIYHDKYIKYINNTSLYYTKDLSIEAERFYVKNISDEWIVDKADNFWTSYNLKNNSLPVQGWKIHISTDYFKANETLEIVSDILLKKRVSFKHIKGKNELQIMYSKNASRLSCGKFITIFPKDDEFVFLLNVLYNSLKGFASGPYILTDKQWKDSNIYYRYGAFQNIQNEKGEYCIYDDKGNLTPDKRDPKYYLPSFIKEPVELKLQDSLYEGENLVNQENKMHLYKIESALKFSNSGGVYVGTKKDDKTRFVMKEAREGVGVDYNNKTCVERLEIERDALYKLKDVDGVVNILDYFKVWKHTFLVEEIAEGIPLATWLIKNYPFKQSNGSEVDLYLENIIIIMDKLKDIISKMHKNGIAMCDLQPQNIIVDTRLNIKLIDFESSRDIDCESVPVLITRGFYSPKNKKAKDADWFSLNRILQFLLLPISPVFDFDANINISHCLWIYDNFGEKFYKYFHNFQLECSYNISNSYKIFYDTYKKAKEIIDTKTIERRFVDVDKTIEKLKLALFDNCKSETQSLINGDVRQFETDCGMLNIQTGGFGAVLALNRISSLTENINFWIKDKIPNITNGKFNDAYLTGRSGIACTLYECGYKKEAMQLIDKVIDNLDKTNSDLSLRSGLSGIGLALISLYIASGEKKYLEKAEDVASIIIDLLVKNGAVNGSDWEATPLGLFDGYSGLSLFFSFLYNETKNKKYLSSSIDSLQKDINGLKDTDGSGTLHIYDKKNYRTLPYLSNGSVGALLAITILQKISNQKNFEDKLSGLKRNGDIRICLEPGLSCGMASFFILDCFENDEKLKDRLINMKPFFIEKQDKIFISGRIGYRLSSDFFSGVSGVILAIESARRKNPISWLPLSDALWNSIQ